MPNIYINEIDETTGGVSLDTTDVAYVPGFAATNFNVYVYYESGKFPDSMTEGTIWDGTSDYNTMLKDSGAPMFACNVVDKISWYCQAASEGAYKWKETSTYIAPAPETILKDDELYYGGPILCKSISEFDAYLGKVPFKFDSEVYGDDFDYSVQLPTFGPYAVSENGEALYNDGDYEKSYIYARELVNMGLSVLYDNIVERGNNGRKILPAVRTIYNNLGICYRNLSDKNEYSVKYITSGAYPTFEYSGEAEYDRTLTESGAFGTSSYDVPSAEYSVDLEAKPDSVSFTIGNTILPTVDGEYQSEDEFNKSYIKTTDTGFVYSLGINKLWSDIIEPSVEHPITYYTSDSFIDDEEHSGVWTSGPKTVIEVTPSYIIVDDSPNGNKYVKIEDVYYEVEYTVSGTSIVGTSILNATTPLELVSYENASKVYFEGIYTSGLTALHFEYDIQNDSFSAAYTSSGAEFQGFVPSNCFQYIDKSDSIVVIDSNVYPFEGDINCTIYGTSEVTTGTIPTIVNPQNYFVGMYSTDDVATGENFNPTSVKFSWVKDGEQQSFEVVDDKENPDDGIWTDENGNQIMIVDGGFQAVLIPNVPWTFEGESVSYMAKAVAHYTVPNSNISNDMLQCAGESSVEYGRGDAVALIDHTNKPDRTLVVTNEGSVYAQLISGDWINDENREFGAMFTPWAMYDVVAESKEVPPRQTMPGSFAYLISLAKSLKNNANWLAIAGAARGAVPYIKSLNTLQRLSNKIANDMQPRNGKSSINPITEIKPYGLLIWGNRTLKDNSEEGNLTATSFLNIRNLVSDVKKQAYITAKKYMFEQNNDILWVNFKAGLTPLLDQMLSGQGLSGYKIIKGATKEKSKVVATIKLYPVYAVEDFDITVVISDEEVTVE